MHVDPADVWEARLRDAPAASAAEVILSALLGYRDSHVLHADDVAQLASALEAWGTLVLGGARPDGSPFVPPTSDERASAEASLLAIAFAERERATAVAAMTARANANARAMGLSAPPKPNAPTAHEIEVLQMVVGERPWAPWGGWIGACMEFLQVGGYLTGGPTLTARITAKGRAALTALQPKADAPAPQPASLLHGECPECGVDIPAHELDKPCSECGALPPPQPDSHGNYKPAETDPDEHDGTPDA